MTLAEILAHEGLRRHEFPVTNRSIFLAHAGVCPLPRRVAEAIRQYVTQATLGDQETVTDEGLLSATRTLVARLLSATPGEIAFVGPTSLALSFVAAGLEWDAGDNVVIYRADYPSNVYPWMALKQRGVAVRFVRPAGLGCIEPGAVLEQVDARTRLVALASCHFISGYRIDLAAIGQLLHERGILFCVDAIQTLGAFPTNVEHVDFLAADAHKWLLGPCAAGILFVRKSLQGRLRPPIYGWHNVRCPDFVPQERLILRSDARRYEAGTTNLLGVVGLRTALGLLLEIGVETIAQELLRKRAGLVSRLQAKGWRVLQADVAPVNMSGIISFDRPGADMAAVCSRLRSAGIVVSLRSDPAGRRYVRMSPHFYNSDAELEIALAAL